jgi:hypothetical protein
MKITRAHYDYWVSKSCRPSFYNPAWGRSVNIHNLIPRAEFPNEYQASDLLAILKTIRRRSWDLQEALHDMFRNPRSVVNPARRRAFCRKWLVALGELPRDRKQCRLEHAAIACQPILTEKERDRLYELYLCLHPDDTSIRPTPTVWEHQKRVVKEILS